MKAISRTVTMNSHYVDVAKRYAEMTGMSLKASIEYAIERALLPEIEEFINHYPNEDFDKLIIKANALLPHGWTITAASMTSPTDPGKFKPMVGFGVGLDLMPTFMAIDEVRVLCTNLRAMTETGGRVVYGSRDQLGEVIQVRRHGHGLVFERVADLESTRRATVSIAASSVEFVVQALETGIEAARTDLELAQ